MEKIQIDLVCEIFFAAITEDCCKSWSLFDHQIIEIFLPQNFVCVVTVCM